MTTISHLLLIDDSDATNNFHNRLLNKLKFAQTFTTCTNGQDAIDYLINSKSCPDLIFLDLNMPVLDGFEFLELAPPILSKNCASKTPTIVILTSSEEDVDKDRCKNLYRNIMFYSKPLTIAQITEIKGLI